MDPLTDIAMMPREPELHRAMTILVRGLDPQRALVHRRKRGLQRAAHRPAFARIDHPTTCQRFHMPQ
jgi:hypothetical protein